MHKYGLGEQGLGDRDKRQEAEGEHDLVRVWLRGAWCHRAIRWAILHGAGCKGPCVFRCACFSELDFIHAGGLFFIVVRKKRNKSIRLMVFVDRVQPTALPSLGLPAASTARPQTALAPIVRPADLYASVPPPFAKGATAPGQLWRTSREPSPRVMTRCTARRPTARQFISSRGSVSHRPTSSSASSMSPRAALRSP